MIDLTQDEQDMYAEMATPIAPHRKTLVKLVMTVEVDIDELEAEYGRTFTVREAQDDARQSMYNAAATAAYPSDRNDQLISRVVSHNAASGHDR